MIYYTSLSSTFIVCEETPFPGQIKMSKFMTLVHMSFGMITAGKS